jgi:hypothetical protein
MARAADQKLQKTYTLIATLGYCGEKGKLQSVFIFIVLFFGKRYKIYLEGPMSELC